MREWQGAFKPPSPTAAKSGGEWESAIARILPGILEGVGRGYAVAEGMNVVGDSTTAEEAAEAVDDYSKATSIFDKGKKEDDIAKQNAQIDDMRNKALKKYGTNDKKLQALVDSGKISTIEANARRHAILQENLSNPILAMFKDDFLNAATPFTGGSGELAKNYFGAFIPTEEERAELAAQEAVRTEMAEKKASIASLQNTFGISEGQAQEIYQTHKQQAMQLQSAERNFKMLQYGSPEVFSAAVNMVDVFNESVMGEVIGYISKGKKFSEQDIGVLKGQADRLFNAAYSKISQFASKMTREDYTSAIKQLTDQRNRFDKIVSDASSLKALEDSVRYLQGRTDNITGQALLNFTKKAPDVVASFKVGREFGEWYIGYLSGDISKQYQANADPRFKALLQSLSGMNAGDTTASALNKANKGEKLSTPEALSLGASLTSNGSAKAVTAAVKANDEGWMKALKQAFSQEDMTLAVFSDSSEWKYAMKSEEGAKVVSDAINTTAQRIIGRQFATGKMPSKVKVDYIDMSNYPNPYHRGKVYRVDTGGVPLDSNVKAELVQMYRILNDNPNILKALGVSSTEEWMDGLFGGKKEEKEE